jgi:hypothetical protein
MSRERMIGLVTGALIVTGAGCMVAVALLASPLVAGVALVGAACWAVVATEAG